MTIRDTDGPDPLLSTPSLPPACPLNSEYAGGSVSLSSELQITGIQELDGASREISKFTVDSKAGEDDHSDEVLVGGSRLSRRAVTGKTGEQSKVHSR